MDADDRTHEGPGGSLVVDLWLDPVCPYSWTASRWLVEASRLRPVEVRPHVMSLWLLHEHRTDVDPAYRQVLERSRGPARVAAAAAQRCGEGVLWDWYAAFGASVFDRWRRPSAEEYASAVGDALARTGLPADLAGAAFSGGSDDALRRSHGTAVALVGPDAGTPVTRLGGRAFFGPVLDAVPRGAEAVRVLDGVRLLAGSPVFAELKRTRTGPPVLTPEVVP